MGAVPSRGVGLQWAHANQTAEGRGRQKPGQNLFEKKVKEIHLLSWIWDLTADCPQSLEAVPDGVDVGHSHKHDLTVGIVL